MLSFVQIDPSKKTAPPPEEGGMDVEDQPPDDIINEPTDMTGNDDDGLEQQISLMVICRSMMLAPGNSLGLRPVEMSCQSSMLTVPLLLEYPR